MSPDQLQLERRPFIYQLRGETQPEPIWQSEFVVNGRDLATLLDFLEERPWFGQTCFEQNPAARETAVPALRGLAPPHNQLGSGRFVLYGCHCGSDFCGVISCAISRTDDEVVWSDIRFEEEPGGGEEIPYPARIPELRFAAAAYDADIAAYLQRLEQEGV